MSEDRRGEFDLSIVQPNLDNPRSRYEIRVEWSWIEMIIPLRLRSQERKSLDGPGCIVSLVALSCEDIGSEHEQALV